MASSIATSTDSKTLEIRLPDRTYAYRVIQRNPDLVSRSPTHLIEARYNACSRSNVEPWFSMYKDIIRQNNISANCIINVDEKPLSSQQTPEKVLTTQETLIRPTVIEEERWANIFITLAISLSGRAFCTQMLIPQRNVPKECSSLKNAIIHVTANGSGWQTMESFEGYIKKDVLKQLIIERAVCTLSHIPILLLDGHSSRKNPSLFDWCTNNNIIGLSLPAHSSYQIQPLI